MPKKKRTGPKMLELKDRVSVSIGSCNFTGSIPAKIAERLKLGAEHLKPVEPEKAEEPKKPAKGK